MTTAEFSQQVQRTIEAHMADEAFDVAALAAACSLSRAQLHRRVRRATGMAPGRLIRRKRMVRAARLLEEQGLSVTEVVYRVGLSHLSHFAKVFRAHHGVLPSVYVQRVAET